MTKNIKNTAYGKTYKQISHIFKGNTVHVFKFALRNYHIWILNQSEEYNMFYVH